MTPLVQFRVSKILAPTGLLSDALLGIVAQRLVRRVCPHCAEPYRADLKVVLGLGGRFYQVHGGGVAAAKHVSILAIWGGRLVGYDIDDTVREIIYEGCYKASISA